MVKWPHNPALFTLMACRGQVDPIINTENTEHCKPLLVQKNSDLPWTIKADRDVDGAEGILNQCDTFQNGVENARASETKCLLGVGAICTAACVCSSASVVGVPLAAIAMARACYITLKGVADANLKDEIGRIFSPKNFNENAHSVYSTDLKTFKKVLAHVATALNARINPKVAPWFNQL